MIEICLKDDNMHIFVMINALICINNYVITCINRRLSRGAQGGSAGARAGAATGVSAGAGTDATARALEWRARTWAQARVRCRRGHGSRCRHGCGCKHGGNRGARER